MMLGSAESEHPWLISYEIILEVFPPMRPRHLNVTDRWTDITADTQVKTVTDFVAIL